MMPCSDGAIACEYAQTKDLTLTRGRSLMQRLQRVFTVLKRDPGPLAPLCETPLVRRHPKPRGFIRVVNGQIPTCVE